MYDEFLEAVDSIRKQTYENIELVLVVDGNDSVCSRVHNKYDAENDTIIHCNDKNRGLSASRNTGWELATGKIVAFIDDDAIADEQWIEKLVTVYEERSVVSVGGKMVPKWVAGRPIHIPEEFYWLIGVTHSGFADGAQEVRNTNGSNISFRRELLEELGGFDESLGRQGTTQMQAEETELCARMRRMTGHGTWYEPDAKVAHKIFKHRTQPSYLIKRAFWQGYSKQVMKKIQPMSSSVEADFLRQLVVQSIPQRLVKLFRSPSLERATQLMMLLSLCISVGVGYLYGMVR